MSDTWTTEIVQGDMSFKINYLLIKKVGESHFGYKRKGKL
jgi:hypothetical protein